MKLPLLRGLIRRRLLINFRADAETVQRLLPAPLCPKLHAGHAIVGICLIRLDAIRPAWLPFPVGLSSENAAHRIAVRWTEPDGTEREGVYIPRRDTGSRLNAMAGGRLFPGEHHLADFRVADCSTGIEIQINARDEGMRIAVSAHETRELPGTSCFSSLDQASEFFRCGSAGYSVTSSPNRLDGISLNTMDWEVRPLAVTRVESTWFSNHKSFPPGTVTYDHALITRDIAHTWSALPDMQITAAAGSCLR